MAASDSSQARASSCSEALVPGPLTNAESSSLAEAGVSDTGCARASRGASALIQAGMTSLRSAGAVINSSGRAPCLAASDSSQARASSCSEALVPGPLTRAESSPSVLIGSSMTTGLAVSTVGLDTSSLLDVIFDSCSMDCSQRKASSGLLGVSWMGAVSSD